MQLIAQIEKCNMNMALAPFHRLPVALGRATKPDWLRHGGVRNRCPGTSSVLGEESVIRGGSAEGIPTNTLVVGSGSLWS